MTGFMSLKYGCMRHFGLGALFHIFVFWIMAEQEGGMIVPDFMKKMNERVKTPLVRKTVIAIGALICVAPIIYCGIASVSDITKNYDLSCIADIIKENHLEDKKIKTAKQSFFF